MEERTEEKRMSGQNIQNMWTHQSQRRLLNSSSSSLIHHSPHHCCDVSIPLFLSFFVSYMAHPSFLSNGCEASPILLSSIHTKSNTSFFPHAHPRHLFPLEPKSKLKQLSMTHRLSFSSPTHTLPKQHNNKITTFPPSSLYLPFFPPTSYSCSLIDQLRSLPMPPHSSLPHLSITKNSKQNPRTHPIPLSISPTHQPTISSNSPTHQHKPSPYRKPHPSTALVIVMVIVIVIVKNSSA